MNTMRTVEYLILAIYVLVCSHQVYGDSDSSVVYSESFSSDPGFTSFSGENVFWDSSAEQYIARAYRNDDESYWAYSPLLGELTTADQGSISFDIKFDGLGATAYPAVAFYSEVPKQRSSEDNSYHLRVSQYIGGGKTHALAIVSNNQPSVRTISDNRSISDGTWYSVRFIFQGNNRISLVVRNRSSNNIIVEKENISVDAFTVRYMGIGYYTSLSSNINSTIIVDNVEISKGEQDDGIAPIVGNSLSLFDPATSTLHIPSVRLGREYYWADLFLNSSGVLQPIDYGINDGGEAAWPAVLDEDTGVVEIPYASFYENGEIQSKRYYLRLDRLKNGSFGLSEATPIGLEFYEVPMETGSNIAAIAKNQRGERLAIFGDRSQTGGLSELHGVSFMSTEEATVTTFVGDDGFPSYLEIEEHVFSFSEFSSDTVDVTIIDPDGNRTTARDISVNSEKLAALREFRESASESNVNFIAYKMPPKAGGNVNVEELSDYWYGVMKRAPLIGSLASCASATAATVVLGATTGVGATLTLGAMAASCTSLGYSIGDLLINGTPTPGEFSSSDQVSGLQCLYFDVWNCAGLAVSSWADSLYKAESEVVRRGGVVLSDTPSPEERKENKNSVMPFDLQVSDFSVSPSDAGPGESITLRAVVANTGNASAPNSGLSFIRSPISRISTSGLEVKSSALSEIDAGDKRTITVSYRLPATPGEYYFGACVDAFSSESNTDNQCSDGHLVLITESASDLQVSDFSVSPSDAGPGESITLRAVVANTGNASAPNSGLSFIRSPISRISTSGLEVKSSALSEIDAGDKRTITVSYRLPTTPGEYYFGACVDPIKGESDSANQCSPSALVTIVQEGSGSSITVDMISIPGGSFEMGGSTGRGWSIPIHTVNVSSFRISKYETTFDQWDACVDDGGCSHKPSDDGFGRGRRPVRVSYNNIVQQFIPWINRKTGKNYRLPSEAEWEYAARAGTSTRYPWSDGARNYANYDDTGGADVWERLAPVGSLRPNKFGLYDMMGNVREWVPDCWYSDYVGAPTDGSAWVDDDGSCIGYRVNRGGDWTSKSWGLYSAFRWGDHPNSSHSVHGFRLVLDN